MPLLRSSGRRAFTLVELLTVIAIIGVLAAILIPSLGRVRENARTSRCAANLRTWGNATALYVNDNKGKLPRTRYVQGTMINNTYQAGIAEDAYLFLNRYLLSASHPCSTWGYNQVQLADYTCTTRTEAGNNLTWAAYGFNHYPSALPVASIAEPGRLVWATEAAGGGGGQRWITPGMLVSSSINLGGAPIKPHNGKHNVLYLDGRVAAKEMRDLVKADFTRDSSLYNPADESVRLAN